MEIISKPQTVTYKDIYQEVTDSVIKALEEGIVIWQCSWNQVGLPKNVTTDINYLGWNVFWLNFQTIVKGYSTLLRNTGKVFSGICTEETEVVAHPYKPIIYRRLCKWKFAICYEVVTLEA